jgi:hypothetical protein
MSPAGLSRLRSRSLSHLPLMSHEGDGPGTTRPQPYRLYKRRFAGILGLVCRFSSWIYIYVLIARRSLIVHAQSRGYHVMAMVRTHSF